MIIALAGTPGGTNLGKLYGFGSQAGAFAVAHVDTLKRADNPVVKRCGEVLEHAIVGFGFGGETGLVLIGVGQMLLGNPLTAGAVAAAAANPVVMTCASIGAIVYGWKALSKAEQDDLLTKIGSAFRIGAEFIRALIAFALDTIRDVKLRQYVDELKTYIGEAAALFNHTVSDVTGALTDKVKELAGTASTVVASGWTRTGGRLPWPGRHNADG